MCVCVCLYKQLVDNERGKRKGQGGMSRPFLLSSLPYRSLVTPWLLTTKALPASSPRRREGGVEPPLLVAFGRNGDERGVINLYNSCVCVYVRDGDDGGLTRKTGARIATRTKKHKRKNPLFVKKGGSRERGEDVIVQTRQLGK